MRIRRRPALAAVLAALSVVLAASVVLVVRYPGPFVHAQVLGSGAVPEFTAVVAAAVAGAAAVYAAGDRFRRRAVVAGAVVTGLTCVVGGAMVGVRSWERSFPGTIEQNSSRSVATSADRRFELVVARYTGWWVTYDVIQLRTRAGILSRQSDRYVACFAYRDDVQPADRFGRARFPGPGTIAVTTTSGRIWTTSFDRATLRTGDRLNYCGSDADLFSGAGPVSPR